MVVAFQWWLVRWSVKTSVCGGRFSVVAGTMVSEDLVVVVAYQRASVVAGMMVSKDFCWWRSLIRGPQCWLVRLSVKTFVGGGHLSEGHSGGWYDGQ